SQLRGVGGCPSGDQDTPPQPPRLLPPSRGDFQGSKMKADKKRNEAISKNQSTHSRPSYVGFVLSALAGAILLVSTSTLSGPESRAKVLDDFEAAAPLFSWQGSAKISTARPAHGKNCLEVQFHSHSGTLTTSLQDGNWTGYDRLLFDVYNPETTPV